MSRATSPRHRIAERSAVTESGCWEWQLRKDQHGYGRIVVAKKTWTAHRYSFFAHNGPIPTGSYVLHSCDNRRCVNPEHLRLGNHAQNMKDRNDRARQSHGSHHRSAKLTESDVLEIRAARKRRVSLSSVAHQFGVSRWCVSNIETGKSWKSVDAALDAAKKTEVCDD